MRVRSPFGGFKDIDPRNVDQTDTLLRWFASMSDIGLQDVLKAIDAMPQYAQNWHGTQRLLADLRRRLRISEGA